MHQLVVLIMPSETEALFCSGTAVTSQTEEQNLTVTGMVHVRVFLNGGAGTFKHWTQFST